MRSSAIVIFLAFVSVKGDKETSEGIVNEGSCVTIEPPSNLDIKWFALEVPVWHYQIVHKTELYGFTASLLKKPAKELTSEDVNGVCLQSTFDMLAGGVRIKGFEGSKSKFLEAVVGQGEKPVYQEMKNGEPIGPEYDINIALTDNKTFMLFVTCYDGKRSFVLASPSKEPLPHEIIEKAQEYLKSNGYESDYFLTVNSSSCTKIDDDDFVSNKDEL